jgi:hypothetical protein
MYAFVVFPAGIILPLSGKFSNLFIPAALSGDDNFYFK